MIESIQTAKAYTDLISNRLEEALTILNDKEAEDRLRRACELVDAATGTSEKLTYYLRKLLPGISRPDFWIAKATKRALEVSGIYCDVSNQGYFHIAVPALPPKKAHGTTSYIATPLMEAVNQFRSSHPNFALKPFKYVMCYVFELAGKDWTRRVDIENWETNFITDIVINHYLPDDDPAHIASCFAIGRPAKETTMLHGYLVPVTEFAPFLQGVLAQDSSLSFI